MDRLPGSRSCRADDDIVDPHTAVEVYAAGDPDVPPVILVAFARPGGDLQDGRLCRRLCALAGALGAGEQEGGEEDDPASATALRTSGWTGAGGPSDRRGEADHGAARALFVGSFAGLFVGSLAGSLVGSLAGSFVAPSRTETGPLLVAQSSAQLCVSSGLRALPVVLLAAQRSVLLCLLRGLCGACEGGPGGASA